jgi:hypothetical protein
LDLRSSRQHPEKDNFNRIHQITAYVEEIAELHGLNMSPVPSGGKFAKSDGAGFYLG